MAKIKCSHCKYEWVTASDKIFVTCPSCLKKTQTKAIKKYPHETNEAKLINKIKGGITENDNTKDS